MKPEELESLVILRLSIGFLCEKEQFGWWKSSFFTQGSNAFLSPLFPRTQLLAQCNGVTRAALLIHDERIGVGNVFHLFRLPEDMEQSIHQMLHDAGLEKSTVKLFASKDTALEYLHKYSVAPDHPGLGPTRVGNIGALRDPQSWKLVAGLYLDAFERRQQTFPYFADIS